MLEWRSFWIGFFVACAIDVLSFMFYNIGYEHGEKRNRLVRPSVAPVQWTEYDPDVILDEFLLERQLREPFMLPPPLPPMPTPRFIPPIYLYQQSPCP